jgi:hypothetical protein
MTIAFTGQAVATGTTNPDGAPDWNFVPDAMGDFVAPRGFETGAAGAVDFSSGPNVSTALPARVGAPPGYFVPGMPAQFQPPIPFGPTNAAISITSISPADNIPQIGNLPLIFRLTFSDGAKRFGVSGDLKHANAQYIVGSGSEGVGADILPGVPSASIVENGEHWRVVAASITDYTRAFGYHKTMNLHRGVMPVWEGVLLVALSAVGFAAIGAAAAGTSAAATTVETTAASAAPSTSVSGGTAAAFGPGAGSTSATVMDSFAAGAGVPVTQTVATGTVAATAGFVSPALTVVPMASGVAATFSGAPTVGAASAISTSAASTSAATSAIESAAAPAVAAPSTPAVSSVASGGAATGQAATALESAASSGSGLLGTGMTAAQLASTATGVIGAGKALLSLVKGPAATNQFTAPTQTAAQRAGLTPNISPLLSQMILPGVLILGAFILANRQGH